MRARSAWTIKSLFTCFFFNAVLTAGFLYGAQQVLSGFHHWIEPFLKQGGPPLPEDVQAAFTALAGMVQDCQRWLLPVGAGAGAAITLLLWVTVMAQGRSLARRAERELAPAAIPGTPKPPREAQPRPLPEKAREAAPVPEPSPQAAVQMLSVLQREGRLVDFLQEDLNLYEDAQIGAAVRGIHEGCRQALKQYVQLKPVFEESEGTQITVPSGFDANAIRLTGNVAGEPPFAGVLKHRGWKVLNVDLPKLSTEKRNDWILTPAEVEIEG